MNDDTTNRPLSPTIAAVIATFAGVGVFLFTRWLFLSDRSNVSDFTQIVVSARMLLAGRDPYAAFDAMARAGQTWPLYYPMPAVLFGVPLVRFDPMLAHAVFVAASGAAFTYAALVAGRPWWLLAFATPSMLIAIEMGQWSPLLTAAAVLPWLGFALVAKPTIGFALLTYRPTCIAMTLCTALVLVSLIVAPAWPIGWWRAIHHAPHVRPPLSYLGGPVILLAVLRWRRPEARVLLALLCVPQTFYAPDTLPLFLVTRTRREAMALTIGSGLAQVIARRLSPLPDRPPRFDDFVGTLWVHGPAFLLCMYLPALIMVLRRPNVGPVPSWLDQFAVRLPVWLRGTPA